MLPTHLAAPLLSTDEREDAEYDLVLIYSIDGDADKNAQRSSIAARCRALGLHVSLSKSRDGDEVFLKLSADDSKLEQVADATKIPKRLRSSGGCMAYSIAMRDAFEPASDSSLFNSMEKTQILLSILELDKEHGGCDVDLDKCVRDKVLTQVLPIHEASQVRKLYHSWCLAPFSFYPFQPLDDIRDYFGPKVSFYFAFVGHLARSLLLPAIVGSIAVGAAVGYYGTLDNPVGIAYSIFMLVWSTALCKTWRRRETMLGFRWHVLDFEHRETSRQEFTGELARGFYSQEGYFVDIPESHRFRDFAEVQRKFTYYDRVKRMCASYFIITPLVLVVLIGTVAILSYRSFLQFSFFRGVPLMGITLESKRGVLVGSILGGVMNAVFISVTNGLYARLARKLNDWENHRTETAYEDALIIKTFLFQAINSYISLFYIAFIKAAAISLVPGHAEYCHDASHFERPEAEIEAAHGGFNPFCMGELSTQLTSLVITRSIIGKTREFAEPKLKAWYRVWSEERAMRSGARASLPTIVYSRSSSKNDMNGNVKGGDPTPIPPMSLYEAQSSASLSCMILPSPSCSAFLLASRLLPHPSACTPSQSSSPLISRSTLSTRPWSSSSATWSFSRPLSRSPRW